MKKSEGQSDSKHAREKTTSENGRYGAIVKAFRPIKDTGSERVDVRVLSRNGERGLDIRSFVTSEKFTGYTRRGLYLTQDMWEELLSHRKRITRLLKENERPSDLRNGGRK